jgi:hypothetical protein
VFRGAAGAPAITSPADEFSSCGISFCFLRNGFCTKATRAQDLNGDGKADIMWRGHGTLVEWQMNGTQFLAIGMVAPNPGDY